MANLKSKDFDAAAVYIAGRGAGSVGDPMKILHFFSGPAATPVTASVIAQNTYTDPLTVEPYYDAVLTISGITGGTIVTLQQSYSSGAWVDREVFTSDVAGWPVSVLESNLRLRAGVKTGEFGSGTCAIRLSQG
jgi:hypothetical protein